MARRSSSNEQDIRSALHRKRLRHQIASGTLIVDELGLAHSRCRIDVAAINGCIHGYEIKSAQDNLGRLSKQIELYSQTLQKLTIVAAPRHIDAIINESPSWCGLIEAAQGVRGGITLTPIRPAQENPDVDPVMLAHLLWRPEAVELLIKIGYSSTELRGPRKQLYELICDSLSLREIITSIREFMVARQTWRVHPTHV